MNPDPEPFRALVEAYESKVFRLIASILGPYRDADAEDLTQDVFLQAYRSWARFRGDSAPGTWLYAIARNRALDARKRARFRLPHLDIGALGAATQPADDPDLRFAVARSMEALPEIYRTLLYLYYWQGSTVDEIAELTGLVPGTVKSYLARARKQVEDRLGHDRTPTRS